MYKLQQNCSIPNIPKLSCKMNDCIPLGSWIIHCTIVVKVLYKGANNQVEVQTTCSILYLMGYWNIAILKLFHSYMHCKKIMGWFNLGWVGWVPMLWFCTPIIPRWSWCCSYATQYKINWIFLQSVVKFTYLLQVGAICLHYSHNDVIG